MDKSQNIKTGPTSYGSKVAEAYKIILWHVLIYCLMHKNFEKYIRWTGNGLEFVILDKFVFFTEFMMIKNENAEPTSDEVDPGERWKECLITKTEVKDRLRGLCSQYYNHNNRKDSDKKPWIKKKEDMVGCFEFTTHKSICEKLNMTVDELRRYAIAVGKKYDYRQLRNNLTPSNDESTMSTAETPSTSYVNHVQRGVQPLNYYTGATEQPSGSNDHGVTPGAEHYQLMTGFIPSQGSQNITEFDSPPSSSTSPTWMNVGKENIPDQPYGYRGAMTSLHVQSHTYIIEDMGPADSNNINPKRNTLKRTSNTLSNAVHRIESRKGSYEKQNNTMENVATAPSSSFYGRSSSGAGQGYDMAEPLNEWYHPLTVVDQGMVQVSTDFVTKSYETIHNPRITASDLNVFSCSNALEYLHTLETVSQLKSSTEIDLNSLVGIADFDARDVKYLYKYLAN